MRSVNSTGNVIYAFITPAITSFSMSIYVAQDKRTSRFVVTWQTANTNIMAKTVLGCYLVYEIALMLLWSDTIYRSMTAAHFEYFRQSKIKLKWHPVLRRKRCCFIQRELSNSGSDEELGPFSILRSVMLSKQNDCFTFCHLMQSMLWILSVTPVSVGKALGIKRCCQGGQMNAFLQFCGRWSGDN